MEEKFLAKLLKHSFFQYGRDIMEEPLSEEDYCILLNRIKKEKDEHTELFEVVEDVVYSYLTNQD